jgi:preprotein translocase subunit SecA
MLKEQVADSAREMLDPTYGVQTTARWATQAGGIQLEARDLKDDDPELITAFLKEEAVRQADELILEKIEEDFPKEVEDEREWNWGAFSKWANARWGLKTTDRQLKQVGRDGLHELIFDQAKAAIDQADFTPVKVFLEKDYGRRSLAAFLANQFTLDIDPARFEGLSPESATDLVLSELRQLYEKKEVEFPVSVGMSRFMAEHSGGNVQRYDRQGLAQWATARFGSPISVAALESASREDIVRSLTGLSERFRVRGQGLADGEKLLDRAFGPIDAGDPSQMKVQDRSALDDLQRWADDQLDSDLTAEQMAELPRSEVHRLLLDGYQRRFRPELREAERALLLEVLDTSWKDHLHFMDHLRQGIGLVGYAQKDPKVEYRREGMKAFDQMWKGIGQQVTGAIFRLETESPGFVGSLWRITEIRHDEAPPEEPPSPGEPVGDSEGSAQGGRTPEQSAIEPIRNRETRVGRNDPCPCGSGKKFKHCHMQTR